ncbi:hypothetical protein TCAL_02903 [Tigriopus californicus]|uniref:G-protein coupled receptors family 1 profile domain-containing protein n=2 Tax=Tigriopus californicus TaxID=6832 RepID=A0A553NZK8_TIGCA|nr:hypothetical protein TCAL_02903 [Tigriopus californicus]
MLLARQRIQRIFHLLMMFLCLWDFLYLVFSIICFSLPTLSPHFKDKIFIYAVPYVLPLAQICWFGSCYSTVALTVERYIAVCIPFFRLRHNIKLRMYVLPILIVAPLYNLPRFFEFRTITRVVSSCQSNLASNSSMSNSDDNNGINISDTVNSSHICLSNEPETEGEEEQGEKTIQLIVTTLRKNPHYITIYVNIANMVVNLFLPTLILIYLNTLIYRALERNKTVGVQLRRNGGSKDSLRKRDVRLTRIAIAIVCVFLMCHLPRFLMNVMELIFESLPQYLDAYVSFNNLLQTLNCSVNYMIYYGHCSRRKDQRGKLELESRSVGHPQSISARQCSPVNGDQIKVVRSGRGSSPSPKPVPV